MQVGGGVEGKWEMCADDPSVLGQAQVVRVPPPVTGGEAIAPIHLAVRLNLDRTEHRARR